MKDEKKPKKDKKAKKEKKGKNGGKANQAHVLRTVAAWSYGPVLQLDSSAPVGPIIYQPVVNGNVYCVMIYKLLNYSGYVAHAALLAEPPTVQTSTTMNITAQTVTNNGTGCFVPNAIAALPFSALQFKASDGSTQTVYHRILDVVAGAPDSGSVSPNQVMPLFDPLSADFLEHYVALSASVGGTLVQIFVQNEVK